MNLWKKCLIEEGELPMKKYKKKKYKWNKAKFAINILKLEAILGIALLYDAMFIWYLVK